MRRKRESKEDREFREDKEIKEREKEGKPPPSQRGLCAGWREIKARKQRNNGTEFAHREAYVATISKYPDARGEYHSARLAIA